MEFTFFSCFVRKMRILIVMSAGLSIVWGLTGAISHWYELRDDDPDRGAITSGADAWNSQFFSVLYLDQGWSAADSLWFYNTSQGSNLLPYSFFLELEQTHTTALFRSNENMSRYGYLPQRATTSNPDGLPVGMVRDEYRGRLYMGLTCAACHTAQIHYQGMAIRIDGGPTGADMETFMQELAETLRVTLLEPEKQQRFIASILKRGEYVSADEVLRDLGKFAQRIKTYTVINSPRDSHRPMTHYGYARLDAFGRIYNRVLEHVMSARQMRILLSENLSSAELDRVLADVEPILTSMDRDHIVERIQSLLTSEQLIELRNRIYNPADAPVSYPFLWDVPQHDYIQWNGRVNNSGLGPMARNAGQVIGVFATLDWQERDGFTLSSVLGGQGFGSRHIDFQSSIDIRNLRRVENHLRKLTSPQWPQQVFPKIDKARSLAGARLFAKYCADCHASINRDDSDRRVVAKMIAVSSVATDSKMAENSRFFSGFSGILRNQYVSTGAGSLLLEDQAPVVALLSTATRNVVTSPDPDKWLMRRWLERSYDFAYTFLDNEVRSSLKAGHYDPDITVDPYASVMAYKARPLNGIWATAPYLHNGSVPTLYDLLLPKKRPGDSEEGEYRPDEFRVGSREFDTDRVGFKMSGYDGFLFRTSIWGNHNTGHEYASGRTPLPDGTILPALDKEQRLDLLEYLKTL